MKLYMYSICDKYTNYIFPFPAYSDQAAIRNFSVEINSNPVSKLPTLKRSKSVGEFFATESGIVEAIVPNEHISAGMNVFRKDE